MLQAALDMNYSVGVLRVENGLDFSEHIKTEETIIFEQSYGKFRWLLWKY